MNALNPKMDAGQRRKSASYTRLTALARARWAEIIVPVIGAALLVSYTHMGEGFIHQLIQMNFDHYMRSNPRTMAPDQPVTIIDIDDKSLAAIGQWPWGRQILARLVDKLTEYGVKSITFDIVFSEPDRLSPAAYRHNLPKVDDPALQAQAEQILGALPDTDQIFQQSIAKSGRVVLGYPLVPQHSPMPAVGIRSQIQVRAAGKGHDFDPGVQKYIVLFHGAVTPLKAYLEAAAGAAHFTQLGIDGLVRQVPLAAAFYGTDQKQAVLPALPLEAIRVAFAPKGRIYANWQDNPQDPPGLKSIQIQRMEPFPINSNGGFRLHLAGHEQFKARYVSVIDVLDGTVDPARLKDKIVLVGTSAPGLLDLRSTPLDSFIPGVELHAEAIEQILSRKFVTAGNAERGKELLVILILVLLSVLGQQLMRPSFLAVLVFGLAGGWYFYSLHMYKTQLTLLDPVLPLVIGSIAYGTALILGFVRAEREKAKLRGAFSLYLSPKLVDELASDPEKLQLGGEMREMTVLFSDIRGFTTISEQYDPQSLTKLINAFLTPMSAAVLDNRGTIDKYMGDALMAFWNAPLDDEHHARHACLAALKMLASLGPLNQRLREESEKTGINFRPLIAGIGLHTGVCCVGNMGSEQRFAYSVLGDTVNLASRLESQTKYYGVGVIGGDACRDATPELAWLELDRLQVKGKTKPVTIWGLLGDAQLAKDDNFMRLKTQHDDFVRAYRARSWDAAQAALEATLPLWLYFRAQLVESYVPETFLTLFTKRIKHFRTHMPAEDWQGVYVADEK